MAANETTKWEYLTYNADTPVHSGSLDSFGEDGWELVVAFCQPSGHVHYIFKRPVT